MNRKQAGVFAVGVLAVAIAIIVAGGLYDRAGQPPAGERAAATSGAAGSQPAKQQAEAAAGTTASGGPASGSAPAGAKPDGGSPVEANGRNGPAAAGTQAGAPPAAGPAAGQQSAKLEPGDGVSAAAPAPSGDTGAAPPAASGQDARPVPPAFDILRVEPDGSTVIAGHAVPGSRVEIVDTDTGKTLLTTDADETGSFVGVFDRPLNPGTYELRLRSVGKDGSSRYSDEVATINVPRDRKGSDLLAMVSKPGEASRIITLPQPETPAGSRSSKAGSTDAGPVASLQQSGEGSGGTQGTGPGGQQGGVQARIHIDAVEIEGDKLYVAGAAPRRSTVRIYADDKFVGQTRATPEGRFVVNGTITLAPGRHTVRADLMDSSGGQVALRAAVPFVRPEGANFAAVSPQMAGAPAARPETLSPDIAKLDEAARKSVSDLRKKIESETPDPVAIEAALRNAEKSLDALARATKASAGGDTVAGALGDRAREALAIIKSLPELGRLDASRLKLLRSRVGDVDSKLASVPAPSMATAGGPATVVQPELTKSENFVIIRRGDTLWQISRRTYGRGVRYTTIYLANSDQISDPNLILPGQVFDVPGKPGKTVDQAIKLHQELLRQEGRGR